MKKTITCIAAVVALGLVQAHAEIVAGYDFNNTAASGDSQANTTAGTFLAGPGAPAFATNSGLGIPPKSAYFGSGGFYSSSRTAAIGANDYLTFNVDVDAGYSVGFSALSFYTQRDASLGLGAPDSYSVFTSQDGFAISVGTSIGGIVTSTDNSFLQHTLDLSGRAELQSVADSTEFRIYMWKNDGLLGGTTQRQFRLDEVMLDGTVIPEPATLGLLGLATAGILISRRMLI